MSESRAAYSKGLFGPREPILDEVLRSSLIEGRLPTIQVDDNTGRLLQILVTVMAPSLVIEIGSLFGYSSLYLARGLPPGGRLLTFEVDEVAANWARRNLERARLADRVDLVVGDAVQHLALIDRESAGLIFIDADKASYPAYLAACYPLLAHGGLLVADDAYADGDFAQEVDGDGAAKGVRAYGRAVGRSARLLSSLVGTDTGLLISLKRSP